MEFSSPLAAMHSQTHAFGQPLNSWGLGISRIGMNSDSCPSFLSEWRSSDFNFKEMSMGQRSSDYFNNRPARGSSPTSSLAVDLDKNFHIDKTPQPPTPRRSLFTTKLFSQVENDADLITPPLTLPSPCPEIEIESSPLPHKLPCQIAVSITKQPPTPDPTPQLPQFERMSAMPARLIEPVLTSITNSTTLQIATDVPELLKRSRLIPTRPTLTRMKGLTTSMLPSSARTHELGPPIPFRFSASKPAAPLLTASTVIADAMLTDSPIEGSISPVLPEIPAIIRPRSAHQKRDSASSNIETSSIQSRRNGANPYQRPPRKQFRRTLSMFESPGDVFKQQQRQQQESGSPLVECHTLLEQEERQPYQIPYMMKEGESIPRITKETMIKVLDGDYSSLYDRSMVIDCRFEYEYQGGHIDGAINFNDKDELAQKLLSGRDDSNSSSTRPTLLIFHCEYSAHRAPIAASYIRGKDRALNAHRYPHLTYPEVYILDGGYSSFFLEHKSRCFPQNYVEMNDEKHANACERGLGRIKSRKPLNRAKTFAFGSRMDEGSPRCALNDSPTAGVRLSSNLSRGLGLGINLALPTGMSTKMDLDVQVASSPFSIPFPLSTRKDARRLHSY